MLRAQIQFTEEQYRKLRLLAREEGVSVAEAVRWSVDKYLSERELSRQERYERAASLVGAFHDKAGATDVAERHDAYLDEAFS